VDVATIIDTTAARRVLVVGSLPPAGRDYDLFSREADRPAVAAALSAHGFEPIQHGWARSAPGGPEVVELMTPADWGLPDHEADALFAQALLLDGRARLFVPAPAHQLLILARKLPRTPGLLEPKHRWRVQEALTREPDAWAKAEARAGDWGVERRLRRLQSRCARPPRARWPPRYVRRPRRGAVIALSGLDGAGKSTQAEVLCTSLTKLGYEAVVVWVPIGTSPSLRRFASGAKRGLARLPVGPLAHADRETVERRLLSQTEDGGPTGGRGRRLAASIWSTVITFANAASYRRSARGTRTGGRIVIFDRYVLDTVVDLRFSYAPEGRLLLQEALVRLLSPAPRCAFLLDASPETAHARKPDWSLAQTRVRASLYRREYGRLGVRRLDAERPADELAAQIAREVREAVAP
jgi:thymidylate kinase